MTSSTIDFKIKNAGTTVNGLFSNLSANIFFDTENYAKSSIETSVETNTISTGIKLRDKHLKNERFLDTSHYPRIEMESSSFTIETDGTFSGNFKLTMKGVSKNIPVHFTYVKSGNTASFDGSFALNRRDYSVGGKSWILADEVFIRVHISATK